MKVDLNDTWSIYDNDPQKMFEAVAGLAKQCVVAKEITDRLRLPTEYQQVQNIVVAGLGGSAIGGDLLRVFVSNKAKIPVLVCRDYNLPQFVNENTLLFVVSYSGNTEETISAYEQGIARGAKAVVITSGGKINDLAQKQNHPVVLIPGGISPRAATGFLLVPKLIVLDKLGLIPPINAQLGDLTDCLEAMKQQLGPEIPVVENLAKQVAQRLFDKVPVIYGSSGSTEAVAARWKDQINENAKTTAYWNVFPELNHNEIVGFELPEGRIKKLAVVLLHDCSDHPRIEQRMQITKDILKPAVADIIEVQSQGKSELARILSLAYLGDYVSVYLALLSGVNPTPIKMIDFLKSELSKL